MSKILYSHFLDKDIQTLNKLEGRVVYNFCSLFGPVSVFVQKSPTPKKKQNKKKTTHTHTQTKKKKRFKKKKMKVYVKHSFLRRCNVNLHWQGLKEKSRTSVQPHKVRGQSSLFAVSPLMTIVNRHE
jgi:hypothetical protein